MSVVEENQAPADPMLVALVGKIDSLVSTIGSMGNNLGPAERTNFFEGPKGFQEEVGGEGGEADFHELIFSKA